MESPTLALPDWPPRLAWTTTALGCSIETEPAAVTTLPIGVIDAFCTAGCAGAFCESAWPERKTPANRTAPVTKTADLCARIIDPSGRVSPSESNSVIGPLQQYGWLQCSPGNILVKPANWPLACTTRRKRLKINH